MGLPTVLMTKFPHSASINLFEHIKDSFCYPELNMVQFLLVCFLGAHRERRLLESLFFTAHLLCVNIWLSDQLRSLLDWEYI